jgi:hypothetical protein
VYNPDYRQDLIMRDQILALASNVSPPLQIVPVEIREPKVADGQLSDADVFFGYYYLNLSFKEIAGESTRPFIGATVADAMKFAIAAIANDDKKLGRLAAEKILVRNLLEHIALSDIEILTPDTAVTIINYEVARRTGVTISDAARTGNTIILNESK